MPDLSEFSKKLKKPMQSMEMEPVEVTASAPNPPPMPEAPKVKGESILDNETFQKALIGLAPALIGAIAGGSEGGAIGGKVGSEALAGMTEAERKAALAKQEAEQKKAEKEDERKFTVGRDEAKFKHDIAMQNAKKAGENPKDFASRVAKLSGTDKQRFDNARMAYDAVQGLKSALSGGSNTFSLVGDNPYTMASTQFEEGIGRMQSGGAITSDEAKRFKAMLPSAMDSSEIQMKKLAAVEKEMGSRLQTLGFSPDEIPGMNVAAMPNLGTKSKMPDVGMSAQAAQKPDFSKMSESDLKKYLGR